MMDLELKVWMKGFIRRGKLVIGTPPPTRLLKGVCLKPVTLLRRLNTFEKYNLKGLVWSTLLPYIVGFLLCQLVFFFRFLVWAKISPSAGFGAFSEYQCFCYTETLAWFFCTHPMYILETIYTRFLSAVGGFWAELTWPGVEITGGSMVDALFQELAIFCLLVLAFIFFGILSLSSAPWVVKALSVCSSKLHHVSVILAEYRLELVTQLHEFFLDNELFYTVWEYVIYTYVYLAFPTSFLCIFYYGIRLYCIWYVQDLVVYQGQYTKPYGAFESLWVPVLRLHKQIFATTLESTTRNPFIRLVRALLFRFPQNIFRWPRAFLYYREYLNTWEYSKKVELFPEQHYFVKVPWLPVLGTPVYHDKMILKGLALRGIVTPESSLQWFAYTNFICRAFLGISWNALRGTGRNSRIFAPISLWAPWSAYRKHYGTTEIRRSEIHAKAYGMYLIRSIAKRGLFEKLLVLILHFFISVWVVVSGCFYIVAGGIYFFLRTSVSYIKGREWLGYQRFLSQLERGYNEADVRYFLKALWNANSDAEITQILTRYDAFLGEYPSMEEPSHLEARRWFKNMFKPEWKIYADWALQDQELPPVQFNSVLNILSDQDTLVNHEGLEVSYLRNAVVGVFEAHAYGSYFGEVPQYYQPLREHYITPDSFSRIGYHPQGFTGLGERFYDIQFVRVDLAPPSFLLREDRFQMLQQRTFDRADQWKQAPNWAAPLDISRGWVRRQPIRRQVFIDFSPRDAYYPNWQSNRLVTTSRLFQRIFGKWYPGLFHQASLFWRRSLWCYDTSITQDFLYWLQPYHKRGFCIHPSVIRFLENYVWPLEILPQAYKYAPQVGLMALNPRVRVLFLAVFFSSSEGGVQLAYSDKLKLLRVLWSPYNPVPELLGEVLRFYRLPVGLWNVPAGGMPRRSRLSWQSLKHLWLFRCKFYLYFFFNPRVWLFFCSTLFQVIRCYTQLVLLALVVACYTTTRPVGFFLSGNLSGSRAVVMDLFIWEFLFYYILSLVVIISGALFLLHYSANNVSRRLVAQKSIVAFLEVEQLTGNLYLNNQIRPRLPSAPCVYDPSLFFLAKVEKLSGVTTGLASRRIYQLQTVTRSRSDLLLRGGLTLMDFTPQQYLYHTNWVSLLEVIDSGSASGGFYRTSDWLLLCLEVKEEDKRGDLAVLKRGRMHPLEASYWYPEDLREWLLLANLTRAYDPVILPLSGYNRARNRWIKANSSWLWRWW